MVISAGISSLYYVLPSMFDMHKLSLFLIVISLCTLPPPLIFISLIFIFHRKLWKQFLSRFKYQCNKTMDLNEIYNDLINENII